MSGQTPTPPLEVPKGYKYITEGSSHMLLPLVENSKNKNKSNQSVFYNPVQIQNRDLSILMISNYAKHYFKEYNKGITILDALAASGLRSMRYYKEIPHVAKIFINDMDDAAVQLARENLKMNSIVDSDKIEIIQNDAIDYMYQHRNQNKFQIIDLDPYGSAAPFIDAAIQAIDENGMLCVTCTDMVVLSGAHLDTCYGRYGSIPINKGKYVHEYALRIVLHTLSTKAAVYSKTITPILSVGMAFYIRLFVQVSTDRAAVLKLSQASGLVHQSTHCGSFYISTLGKLKEGSKTHYLPSRGPPFSSCETTNAVFKIGGPIWLQSLHDKEFINQVLQELEQQDSNSHNYISTKKPICGLLTSCLEELNDVPLFYNLSDLCNTIHCTVPPISKIFAALRYAGYNVSGQHKEPQAIKTNAPPAVIWSVLKSWIHNNNQPVNKKWITGKNEDSVSAKILKKDYSDLIEDTIMEKINNFDWSRNFKKPKKEGIQRFPMNPEKHWGPKPRAVGNKRKFETHNNEHDHNTLKKVEREEPTIDVPNEENVDMKDVQEEEKNEVTNNKEENDDKEIKKDEKGKNNEINKK